MKKSPCSLLIFGLAFSVSSAASAAQGQTLEISSAIDSSRVLQQQQVSQRSQRESNSNTQIKDSGSMQSATESSKRQLDASDFPDVQQLLEQSKLAEAIRVLEQKQALHENNAPYFNLLGVLYLQQKQFASAAAAFERVVLIESDNAGAWLDLAIAKMEAGEFEQAKQFFDYIVEAHRPTPQIMGVINAYRQRMARLLSDSQPWRNQFEAIVGRDTNANSGIIANHILVTFEGKEIDLPLTQYKARPDSFHQISNRTHFQSKLLDQHFAFDTAITNRSFVKEHAYSFTDASLGSSLSHSFSQMDVGLSGSVEHFIWGNHSLLNNSELSFFAEKNFASCQLSYVLDYESRRYTQSSALNARSLWNNFGASCGGELFSHYRWDGALIVRRADDKPIGFRAGGITRRQENIVRMGFKLPSQLKVDLSFSFGRAADSEGYSALLENNAKRFMQRRNYRLHLSYPLSTNWLGFVSYEDNRNDSNIPLFQQRGHSLYGGLRYSY